MSSSAAPGWSRVAVAKDAVLAQIVDRLVRALAPERIYLFGSQARGDTHRDSDYDILVVVGERTAPGYQMEHRAYQALGGLGIAKDVVIMTRERFNRQREVIASLPATVEREGRLLYAA
ncbi:MAG: nucleotidyltransferase domain-containing protein [Chloroflexota bacterium]